VIFSFNAMAGERAPHPKTPTSFRPLARLAPHSRPLEEIRGGLDGRVGGLTKSDVDSRRCVSVWYQIRPPLPGVPADRRRGEVEGPVRDAGVDMDSSVVVPRIVVIGKILVVVHVSRLRVAVERGTRVAHRAKSLPAHLGNEKPSPVQPVGLVRALSERVLLDERPENVRARLVERTRLAVVLQPRRVLGDAVCELVSDHVDRLRQRADDEQLMAAVAVDHLASIPEGVVEVDAEVHARDERKAAPVDTVPIVRLLVERVGRSGAAVRLVHGVVVRRGVALTENQAAREVVPASVVNVRYDERSPRPRRRGARPSAAMSTPWCERAGQHRPSRANRR
jgi:hypothetical protein